MSYSVQDRYGGLCSKYNNALGPSGTGRTWWPDYGPTTRAFSFQEKQHPTETIFENVVKPWTRRPGAPEPQIAKPQFRHPQAAREGILQGEPEPAAKLKAHEVTSRQAALQRSEMRQRQMDQWLGDPPMSLGAKDLKDGASPKLALKSRSEGSLVSSQASREVYEKHGWLVGRHKGSIADGRNGARPRKAHPLSFHAMLLAGGGSGSSHAKSGGSKKQSGQWRICPESAFVFDQRSFLPVPRGGWGSQVPIEWPESKGNTRREFAAPLPFAEAASGGATASSAAPGSSED